MDASNKCGFVGILPIQYAWAFSDMLHLCVFVISLLVLWLQSSMEAVNGAVTSVSLASVGVRSDAWIK